MNGIIHDLRNISTITKVYIQIFDHNPNKDLCAEECFRLILALDKRLDIVLDIIEKYKKCEDLE